MYSNLSASELTKYGEVFTGVKTKDESGSTVITYTSAGNAWFSVTPKTAVETEAGNAQSNQIESELKCRYRVLNSPDKIVIGTMTYYVTGPMNPDQKNLMCTVTCRSEI